jgi:hypothetical protein
MDYKREVEFAVAEKFGGIVQLLKHVVNVKVYVSDTPHGKEIANINVPVIDGYLIVEVFVFDHDLFSGFVKY